MTIPYVQVGRNNQVLLDMSITDSTNLDEFDLLRFFYPFTCEQGTGINPHMVLMSLSIPAGI